MEKLFSTVRTTKVTPTAAQMISYPLPFIAEHFVGICMAVWVYSVSLKSC